MVLTKSLPVSAALLALAVGWVPARALVLLVPVAVGFVCYRAFFAKGADRELIVELYDLELLLLAPCLWLASHG